MKSGLLGAAAMWAALTAGASAETFSASKISFRDITGTVEIKTTTGSEIDIAVRQGDVYRQIRIEEKDGAVIVSADPWKEEDGRNCCDRRISRTVDNRKDRKVTTGEPVDEAFFKTYPIIEVLMPYEGDVDFTDARVKLAMERISGSFNLDACYVYGETGDVGEAAVGVIHGSRLVMGDVAGGLEVDMSGDADLRVGNAGIVDVDMAGPGDLILGDIDGMFDVSIAGSGLVRATHLDGPMTARIAGSGAIAVKGGRADQMRAWIDGSGSIFFRGAAVDPELTLYGSGEVHLDSIAGKLVRHGGGDIFVGEKKLAK
ncbi:MAG: hypothetical protein R3C58_00655 [Parvularculaceae bacterium]